jgi:hypothetical protein
LGKVIGEPLIINKGRRMTDANFKVAFPKLKFWESLIVTIQPAFS